MLAVGLAGAGLYAHSLAHCAQQRTDGFLAGPWVKTFGGGARLVSKLTDAGLWEAVDGGYRVHDWLAFNPSREAFEARREAGRDAASKRWGTSRHDAEVERYKRANPDA